MLSRLIAKLSNIIQAVEDNSEKLRQPVETLDERENRLKRYQPYDRYGLSRKDEREIEALFDNMCCFHIAGMEKRNFVIERGNVILSFMPRFFYGKTKQEIVESINKLLDRMHYDKNIFKEETYLYSYTIRGETVYFTEVEPWIVEEAKKIAREYEQV